MADPTSPAGVALNADLGRLVAPGQILRIKVWARDGTVVFSDLPALRGRQFPVEDDLLDVFAGNPSTEFSDGSGQENVFERGLAAEFLSIYLPVRSSDGSVIAVYEVYEDAAPIVADIAQSRQDLLLIVGTMGLGLLVLLVAAFSVASQPADPPEPAAGRTGRHRADPDDGPPAQPGAVPVARPELRRRQHDHRDRWGDRVREPGRGTGAGLRAGGPPRAVRLRIRPSRRHRLGRATARRRGQDAGFDRRPASSGSSTPTARGAGSRSSGRTCSTTRRSAAWSSTTAT